MWAIAQLRGPLVLWAIAQLRGPLVVWAIAQVRDPGAVSYSSGKGSSDAVGHSLEYRSSSQYQPWPHPHIFSEVANEDITYQIFPIRICQNLGKSDAIMWVCFCACAWAHVL